MFIARFFLGFGIGPKSATVPIYAAETTPPAIRGVEPERLYEQEDLSDKDAGYDHDAEKSTGQLCDLWETFFERVKGIYGMDV